MYIYLIVDTDYIWANCFFFVFFGGGLFDRRAQGKVRVGPESAALSFHWRAQWKVCVGLESAALTLVTVVVDSQNMANIWPKSG